MIQGGMERSGGPFIKVIACFSPPLGRGVYFRPIFSGQEEKKTSLAGPGTRQAKRTGGFKTVLLYWLAARYSLTHKTVTY